VEESVRPRGSVLDYAEMDVFICPQKDSAYVKIL